MNTLINMYTKGQEAGRPLFLALFLAFEYVFGIWPTKNVMTFRRCLASRHVFGRFNFHSIFINNYSHVCFVLDSSVIFHF